MQWTKVRSSEACLRAIVDATPLALIAVNLQGIVVAFNERAETLFGLPASAILGHPVAQGRLPEFLRRCFSVSLRRACACEPAVEERFEIEGMRADGHSYLAEGSLYTAGAGEHAVLTACLQDIGARRQAEKKTEERIQILRMTAEGNHALIRATSETGLFQAMCRVIVETGGYRMAWVGQAEHDEEKSVKQLAHAGHEADYLSLAKISWGDNAYGRGPTGMAIRTGMPQFNNDIRDNPVMGPWRERALERGYLSSISLPLRDNSGVFGALTIYASEPNAFSPENVALLIELAADISYGATALRTRREHSEMERTLQLVKERNQAEDALRASEERFRLLVDQAVDGIFLSDAAGHYLDANSAGCTMLGYTREEILSRTFLDVLAPGQVSRLEHSVAQLAEGQVTRAEWRFRRKDGSEMEGEVVGRQLPDGRLLGILRDVTGRKQAEDALRANEQRIRLATEATEVGIWEWNVLTSAIQWDAQMFRIYGIPPTGDGLVTYAIWASAVLPEDLAQQEELLRKHAREGGVNHREFRIRRPDGEIRYIQAREALRANAQGQAGWVVGTNLDITERKRAEERLRESEERFRGIYLHAGTGISITALDGRFQSCNPAYAAMLGYTENELLALNFSDLVHAEDREANMVEIRRLLAEEIPSFEIVNRYVAKGGKPIWVHKHVSLLRDATGRPTHMTALVTDITERKLYEERIDLLMHEVNHRAKNMLAVVLAVARQTFASTPQKFIGRFEKRIKAMAASQDVLVKNEWKGVPIEELVRSQLAHFSDLIGTRIELRGPPVFITASAAQTIGMALHELATNAGKYGALSSGDGRLRVEWNLGCAEGKESFAMSWREEDGPPVTPPARRGFGSTVICRMVEESLDGKVELDYAPAGLSWHMQCAAEEVLDSIHAALFPR